MSSEVLLILSFAFLLFWIVRTDAPYLYAPIVSACAVKRNTFIFSIFSITLLALLIQHPVAHSWDYSSLLAISSSNEYIAASLVSFLVVFLVSRFCPCPSIGYAFLGAVMGIVLAKEGSLQRASVIELTSSWVTAPLVSFALAFLLYKGYSLTLGRWSVHMIKLYNALRVLMLAGMVLLTMGFASNYSLLFSLDGALFGLTYKRMLLIVLLAALIYLLTKRRTEMAIRHLTEREFDVNFPCSLSVVFSTAIMLLVAGRLNILLSAPYLIVGALLGVGSAQGKEKLEATTIWKMGLGLVLAPSLAFVLSYFLYFAAFPSPEKQNAPFILVLVLTMACTVLVCYLFFSQRLKAERRQSGNIGSQQQLFENQKALNALDVKSILAENQNLYNRLEQKRSELINVALKISEQKEFIDDVYAKTIAIDTTEGIEEKTRALKDLQVMLLQRKSFSREMDSFYAQAEVLHKDFSAKLQEKFPNLTAQEKKLATLLRLGFSSKEIATLMNISAKSAEIGRYRLRKKLDLDRSDNLIQFIQNL